MPRRARAVLATAVTLVLAAIEPAAVSATSYPGFLPMITDSSVVLSVPLLRQPEYLLPILDPTFGTAITRISDDAGNYASPLDGQWGTIARHLYSKIQPWNANGSLIELSNSGSGLDQILLHGDWYVPMYGPCPNYDRWDSRWHPLASHWNEQINVNEAGTELSWFDVVNCVLKRSWTLPIVADYGIGSGEGNVSRDGRYVVIANQQQMVVVDMDPAPPNAPPYPYQRFGPIYTFAACSLDVAQPAAGRVSNVSISPSGRYIDVKYGGLPRLGFTTCDTLCDMHRIFEVDTSLAIQPHNMADTTLRCGSFAARPNGWIFPLKHADMTLDPDDGNEDVIIGGRACPGATFGRVVKVRLRDGKVTPLTDPKNEASYSHGSARNVQRPGWFYVTYSRDPSQASKRFFDEIVAVRTDGSGMVQRFAHYHSTASTFDSEAKAVPSPDGLRVMFTSDWADNASSPPGSVGSARDFIIDARSGAQLAAPRPELPRELALVSLLPNPSRDGLHVTFVLPHHRPAALELFDVSGRRLMLREVGSLGAGMHTLALDEERTLAAGVYFVTLTDGRTRRTARAVVLE